MLFISDKAKTQIEKIKEKEKKVKLMRNESVPISTAFQAEMGIGQDGRNLAGWSQ
jgi:hypothetical protein